MSANERDDSSEYLGSLESCVARALLAPDPIPARLGQYKDYVFSGRTQPTSAELRSQFLQPYWADPRAPWENEDSEQDEKFNSWLFAISNGSGPLSPGDSERQEWAARLQSIAYGSDWCTLAIAMPCEDSPARSALDEILSLLTLPPFPFPVLKIPAGANCTGTAEYVCTVLPRLWVEVISDLAIEYSVTDLGKLDSSDLTRFFSRRITDAEFALSLPQDFSQMKSLRACNELSHILAFLMVPGRKGIERERFIFAPPRARLGVNASISAPPAERWGAAASIAFPLSRLKELGALFPFDPRYHGLDPVSRLIDVMGATRTQPQDWDHFFSEWRVYQGRWGYFFPGYLKGFQKGFELLVKHGAVVSGIALMHDLRGQSESAIEFFTTDSEVKSMEVRLHSRYDSLSAYLQEQRMWMTAYDMAPVAPRLQEIPSGD